MNRQSQWLFEAPFTLEILPEISPYPALEFEAGGEINKPRPDLKAEQKKLEKKLFEWLLIGVSEEDITDLIFGDRHPEFKLVGGRKLNSIDSPDLVKEWKEIRNLLVRPMIVRQKSINKCADKCSLSFPPLKLPTTRKEWTGIVRSMIVRQTSINKCADKCRLSFPLPKLPTTPKQKKRITPKQNEYNPEYHNLELEPEWELQEDSPYSFSLGEEEWETKVQSPARRSIPSPSFFPPRSKRNPLGTEFSRARAFMAKHVTRLPVREIAQEYAEQPRRYFY
jgi:hypothetical protein